MPIQKLIIYDKIEGYIMTPLPYLTKEDKQWEEKRVLIKHV
jgi:hypothetical protein